MDQGSNDTLRVLDLFSGIGGISLGLERAGMRTVAFCEREPFCRAVLAERFPGAPIHDDVRTLSGDAVGTVDVIAGGFPCQDISVAGKGAGIDGERSGLWVEMFRLVRELRPDWVLAENVPALRTRGADRVLGDLESEGYACWPLVVGARHVGAPHRRDRIWIVAHRNSGRLEGVGIENDGRQSGPSGHQPDRFGRPWADAQGHGGSSAMGNAASGRLGVRGRAPDTRNGRDLDRAVEVMGNPSKPGQQERHAASVAGGQRHPAGERARWPAPPGFIQHEWEPPRVVARAESGLGSDADGLPARLVPRERREALRALGNSVVPQVVEAIGRAIQAEHARFLMLSRT